MAYTNTFIRIAADCPVDKAEIPVSKRDTIPAHVIQYQLLTGYPYQYNHEELIFEVYVRQKGIDQKELATQKDEIWQELFSKGHPCMRASSLTKRYGFGVHYNSEGKIAIYPAGSENYQELLDNDEVKKLPAMKNKR